MSRFNLKARYQSQYGIKTSLRGYQLQALGLSKDLPAMALLMDPRLGKTRVDVAISGRLWKQGLITRWVIIGPSIAKSVWKEEIEKTLDIPYKLEIITGKRLSKIDTIKTWKDEPGKLSIMIMNFEATWRLKKFLYKWNPDRITVDESHRIKHRSSKQSRTIQVLGRRATYRSILTGTLMSKPTDVYAQFNFLMPGYFPARWADFLDRYADKMGYGGYKPKTYKNLDEMSRKIAAVSFQLTRAQAGGFPQEQYQDIHFELSPAVRKHYTSMENQLKTMVNGEKVIAKIILVQGLRLQQITGGFLPVDYPEEDLSENVALGRDRINALSDLVQEYPTEEPLVIFAKFKYEILAIQELLKAQGRNAGLIVGGIRQSERDRTVAAFQAGHFDTVLAQVRAAGIAIDLSRADTAIFYSTTHSFIDYEQAKARIIARTGGKKSFLNLCAMDTVDEEILQSVRENADFANLILRNFKGK